MARADKIRRIGNANNRHLAILADLQGPKIRTRKFREGGVELAVGDRFCLNADCVDGEGDRAQVGVTYSKLAQDVKAGNTLVQESGALIDQLDEVASHFHARYGDEEASVEIDGGRVSGTMNRRA